MARKQTAPTTPAEWAGWLAGQGYAVVPLRPRLKEPSYGRGWQAAAIRDPAEVPVAVNLDGSPAFRADSNVGVLLGEPSGNLVDIDLDAIMAVRLGARMLPQTDCVFGRNKVGMTHRLWRATRHDKKFTEEVFHAYDRGKRGEKIIEVRYDGRQTMFPGSIHPDGDALIVSKFPLGTPASIDLATLRQEARILAATCLISAEWPEAGSGRRDEYAMALIGGLLWNDLPPDVVTRIIGQAAAFVGDEEFQKRTSTVERCRERIDNKENVTGFPTLEQDFGLPDFGQALKDCLRIKGRKPEPLPSQPRPAATPQPPRPAVRVQLIERPYRPFPVEALPPVLREMVRAVSASRNVDPGLAALPALAAAAAAIGGSHAITMNGDWIEPCVLWTASVCESGTRKTPAFDAALTWFRCRQTELAAERALAEQEDEAALAEWRAAGDDRGPRPARTAVDRVIWTSDGTIEGIVPIWWRICADCCTPPRRSTHGFSG